MNVVDEMVKVMEFIAEVIKAVDTIVGNVEAFTRIAKAVEVVDITETTVITLIYIRNIDNYSYGRALGRILYSSVNTASSVKYDWL